MHLSNVFCFNIFMSVTLPFQTHSFLIAFFKSSSKQQKLKRKKVIDKHTHTKNTFIYKKSSRLARPNWLVLIYLVEKEMLRISTQAVFKNIEPFRFYQGFPEVTLESSFLRERFLSTDVRRMVEHNELEFFVEVHL